MSGAVDQPTQCEVIADELMELALGTLSGRRRSDVLDHVGQCQLCSAELDQLSTVVEALQQLAPRVQPPLGFEARVAGRLHPKAASRPWRSRRVGALIAAAAVVMLAIGLGAVVAHVVGNGTGESAGRDLESAKFTSDGKVIGELYVSAGSPAWMLVTMRAGGWQGTVTCKVTLSGGQVETIGVFEHSGDSTWAAPLPSTAVQVRSAQLVAPDGTVLASAQLEE